MQDYQEGTFLKITVTGTVCMKYHCVNFVKGRHVSVAVVVSTFPYLIIRKGNFTYTITLA